MLLIYIHLRLSHLIFFHFINIINIHAWRFDTTSNEISCSYIIVYVSLSIPIKCKRSLFCSWSLCFNQICKWIKVRFAKSFMICAVSFSQVSTCSVFWHQKEICVLYRLGWTRELCNENTDGSHWISDPFTPPHELMWPICANKIEFSYNYLLSIAFYIHIVFYFIHIVGIRYRNSIFDKSKIEIDPLYILQLWVLEKYEAPSNALTVVLFLLCR